MWASAQRQGNESFVGEAMNKLVRVQKFWE